MTIDDADEQFWNKVMRACYVASTGLIVVAIVWLLLGWSSPSTAWASIAFGVCVLAMNPLEKLLDLIATRHDRKFGSLVPQPGPDTQE